MAAVVSSKSLLIEQLRELIAVGEQSAKLGTRPIFSTGCPALDHVLPHHGLMQGSLVECLDDHFGSGAETLALLLTRAVKRTNRVIVVMDRDRQFYPPAALAWKLPQRFVIVQPTNAADELWAAVQALRSRAVAAVWLRRDRLTAFDFRRLRLAAEEGGTLGILLRSVKVRGQPTWADVQWWIQPQASLKGRRLRVELTRCRGGASGSTAWVELDDVAGSGDHDRSALVKPHETLRVSSTATLADPTTSHRSAGLARTLSFAASP
jgi:protein ImuA